MSKNRRDEEKLTQLRKQYEQCGMTKGQVERMKEKIEQAKRENGRKHTVRNVAAAVAAAAAVFIALPNTSAGVAYAMSNLPIVGRLVEVVTFRDYRYEDERHNADVKVPELVPEDRGADAEGTEEITEIGQTSEEVEEKLEKSTDEINAEIREITDRLIAEFEEGLAGQEGYQDLTVSSEILSTGEDYFTLKLICYQAAGSGAEWDYFYTIDLRTGERLALADLFVEGADYLTPISENIKEQMRQQMAEDENKMYWVDTDDLPEWNFQSITDETSFYLNEDGNLVICFNEGDVAPMYMGTVEFVIPADVVADIRRQSGEGEERQ